MLTTDQLRDLIGTDAYGDGGEKIGKIEQVYIDDATQAPAFAAVHTGFLGMKESFVPIDRASFDGGHLTVPYGKDTIKDAPAVDADPQITPEQAEALYRHYGLDYEGPGTAEERARAHGRGTETAGTGTTGRTGRSTDDAMTRSEEHLDVGTRQHETGRVRLRKYVVTENVTKTVPVGEERAVLEHEPITDENRDRAYAGPDLSEADHEVVLHKEEPVVSKETKPVERVRLGTQQVQHEETVNDELRKEKIDVDDDNNALS